MGDNSFRNTRTIGRGDPSPGGNYVKRDRSKPGKEKRGRGKKKKGENKGGNRKHPASRGLANYKGQESSTKKKRAWGTPGMGHGGRTSAEKKSSKGGWG